MCGRFALGLDQQEIRIGINHYFPRLRGGGNGRRNQRRDRGQEGHDDQDEDRDDQIPWEGEERFRPRNWNVAPRSNGVVLRYRRPGGHGSDGAHGAGKPPKDKQDKGELVIETMQWGLIPHWSKHPPHGPLNTINARSENLTDPGAGGMWQSLKGPKRCAVVVEGYYEWQKKGTTKIPHFTRIARPTASSAYPLMLIAGLYDTVTYEPTPSDPHPAPISTFTILTTTPCESLKFLHDRMPVILRTEEDVETWLDCRDGWTDKVAKLCKPYEGKLECYPVQPEVGKVGTNSSSYIVPVSERKDGIASFFKKQETVKSGKANAGPTKKGDKDEKQVKHEDTAVHRSVLSEEDEAGKAGAEELKRDGLGQGIGDDSNAPQVENEIATETPASERKRRRVSGVSEESGSATRPKRLKDDHATREAGTTKEEGDVVVMEEDDKATSPKTRKTVHKTAGKTNAGATSVARRTRAATATTTGQSSIESFLNC